MIIYFVSDLLIISLMGMIGGQASEQPLISSASIQIGLSFDQILLASFYS